MSEIKEICETDADIIHNFFYHRDDNQFAFFYSRKTHGIIQYYVNNGGTVFGPYSQLPKTYLNLDGKDTTENFSWYGFVDEQIYVIKNGVIVKTTKETAPAQEEINELLEGISTGKDSTPKEEYYENTHILKKNYGKECYFCIEGKKLGPFAQIYFPAIKDVKHYQFLFQKMNSKATFYNLNGIEYGPIKSLNLCPYYDEKGDAILDQLENSYIYINGEKKDFFDGKCVRILYLSNHGHTLIIGKSKYRCKNSVWDDRKSYYIFDGERLDSKKVEWANLTKKGDLITIRNIKGCKYFYFNEKQISMGVKGKHLQVLSDYICYTRNNIPYIMKNGKEYNGDQNMESLNGFIYLDKGVVYFEENEFSNWWSDLKNKTHKQEENYERFAVEGKLAGE